jgi:putative transposase
VKNAYTLTLKNGRQKMARKRKKHPKTVKAKVAIEALKETKTLSELSSIYKIHPNMIGKWKKQLKEGAPEVFSRGKGGEKSEEEITGPLYEEIGRLKMEIDWLKKKL